MLRRLHVIFTAFFIIFLFTTNAFAISDFSKLYLNNELPTTDINLAKNAAAYLGNTRLATKNQNNYSKYVKQIKDKDLATTLQWLGFVYGALEPHYDTVTKILSSLPDIPKKEILRQRVLESIIDKINNNDNLVIENSIKWYENIEEPNSKELFVLLNAYERYNNISDEGRKKKIVSIARKIWNLSSFSDKEESDFLTHYGYTLSEKDYLDRIDSLLLKNKIEDAKKLLTLVKNKDSFAISDAKIKLITGDEKAKESLGLISQEASQNDEMLLFSIMFFLDHKKEKKDRQKLYDLFKLLPDNSLTRSSWWNYQHIIARDLLKEGNYKLAYLVATKVNTGLSDSDYFDKEWLAGWIAMRFLSKNDDKAIDIAIKHFKNVYEKSSYAISRARGAYFLSEAYKATGDNVQSQYWLDTACLYPFAFYGQMAIVKSGKSKNDAIKKALNIHITQADYESLKKNKLFKMGLMLNELKEYNYAKLFIKQAIENASSAAEVYLILEISKAKMTNNIYEISRYALRHNVAILDISYPRIKSSIISEMNSDLKSTTMALLRQESGFSSNVVSHKGAAGLMQIMPDTARILSKKIGIKYNNNLLYSNTNYNIKLGSFYLKSLLVKYNNFPILAIAAYNAGPTSVDRWIKTFGDPRKYDNMDNVIDWVEQITYGETRNYVMRILEGKYIYEYMMDESS